MKMHTLTEHITIEYNELNAKTAFILVYYCANYENAAE